MFRYLFFLFFTLTLRGNLSITENEPSVYIDGVVNVITGSVCLSATDLMVQGAEPIPLRRHFLSGHHAVGIGASILPPHLYLQYSHNMPYNGRQRWYVKAKDANGSLLTFISQAPANLINRHPQLDIIHPADIHGLSNTARGILSARTNFQNFRIDVNLDANITIFAPDGTERHYFPRKVHLVRNPYLPAERTHFNYILREERLPSGHWLLYDYDARGDLRRITSTNPAKTTIFACADIPQVHFPITQGALPPATVTTSDGRMLTYHLQEHLSRTHRDKIVGCAHRLSDITSSHVPHQHFEYHTPQSPHHELLTSIQLPEGRGFSFTYYHADEVGGMGDPRYGRVKAMYGPKNTLLHTFSYDVTGHTSTVTDFDGGKTVYRYSEVERIETIARYYSDGALYNEELFTWQGANLKTKILCDAHHTPLLTRTLSYDPFGNVLKEEFAGVGIEAAVTEYAYNDRHLPIRKQEPGGKITLFDYLPATNLPISKLTCDGKTIKIREFLEYDKDHILIRQITDDGNSPDKSNLSGITARKIREITPYTQGPYVGMPHTIAEKTWDGAAEKLLRKEILTYTTGGKIAQRDIYDAADTLRYSLATKYNAYGLPIEETNALGQKAVSKYDANGNKISFTDFSGQVDAVLTYNFPNCLIKATTSGYDGIVKTTAHTYDTKHRKTSTTDPYGKTTTFDYDTYHLLAIHDPEGHTVRYTYDAMGNKATITIPNGETTHFTYNIYGKPLAVAYPDSAAETLAYFPDGSLKSYTDPQGTTTSYSYDFLGRTLAVQNLVCERYAYDAFHLRIATDAEEYQTTYQYDSSGRKIAEERNGERATFEYDALNRLHITRREHLASIVEYDLLDRIIEERQEDDTGAILSRTLCTYDSAGNKKTIISFIDGQESTHFFQYDSLNRLVLHIDPLGHRSRTDYNNAIPQKTETDPLGQQTITTYDSLGHVAAIEKKNPFGERLLYEEFTYTPTGKLQKHIQNTDHITQWEYGACDRLIALTEGGSKTTRYSYTLSGQLDLLTKPDGTILKHSYDSLGCLKELLSSDDTIHYTYTYDRLKRLKTSQDQRTGAITQKEYDPCGRIISETLANNQTLASSYDSLGRKTSLALPDQSTIQYTYGPLYLKTIEHRHHTQTYTSYDQSGHLLEKEWIGSLGKTSYAYDLLGRRTSYACPYGTQHITAFDAAGNIEKIDTNDHTSEYTYDPLYQIVSEPHHTYTYDASHNRTQKDEESYAPDALHQLASHFTHDPNGNPISDKTSIYHYDALDRLISVETPSQTISFTYDADHRRLAKTVNGATLYFLYDGQKEIGAVDDTGALIELRILNPTVPSERNGTAWIELDSTPYAVMNDLQGNISALISLEGSIFETYDYTVFGEEVSQSRNPWRYASKRVDDETGLIYFGRRYYSPKHGRWLTPDPAGHIDSCNLYQFVYNNPLIQFDLYGLLADATNIVTMPDGSIWLKADPPPMPTLSSTLPPPSVPLYTIPGADVSVPMTANTLLAEAVPIPQYPGMSFLAYEQNYPPQDASGIFNYTGGKTSDNFTIIYANGMANTLSDAQKSTLLLSQYAQGYNMTLAYNATHGTAGDYQEYLLGRNNILTEAAMNLRGSMLQAYEDKPGMMMLVVGHSQGVLNLKLALLTVDSKVQQQVVALAIAPAACIEEKLCRQVRHLISKSDLIPGRTGALSAAIAQGTAVLLDKHPNAKGWGRDHGIDSPTYKAPIEEYVADFIKTYGGE